jgi:hypothetical protein
VPAFAPRITPITLATKNIVDGEYCFDRTLTVCEETSTTVDRELCTFEYVREDVVAPCTTTQVLQAQNLFVGFLSLFLLLIFHIF